MMAARPELEAASNSISPAFPGTATSPPASKPHEAEQVLVRCGTDRQRGGMSELYEGRRFRRFVVGRCEYVGVGEWESVGSAVAARRGSDAGRSGEPLRLLRR